VAPGGAASRTSELATGLKGASSMSTSEQPRLQSRQSITQSLVAAGLGLLFGLALHVVAVWLRDYGPAGNGWSLRGNGALIVLPVALVGLVIGEVICAVRRLWLALLLLPLAIVAGLFIIAGSF
jgi:hypothetical protein